MPFLLDQVRSLDLVKYLQTEVCSWVPSDHVSTMHVGLSSMAFLLSARCRMVLWVSPAEKPSPGGRDTVPELCPIPLCVHGDVPRTRLCISVSNIFWFQALFLFRSKW